MADYRQRIETGLDIAAAMYGIDPDLFRAMIEVESGFKPNQTRYEPEFQKRYIDPKMRELGVRGPEEARQLATSYGPMQVMYQTARELGFTGTPEQLMDPVTNIQIAARKWQQCVSRTSSIKEALKCYNGSKTDEYPNRVFKLIGKFK